MKADWVVPCRPWPIRARRVLLARANTLAHLVSAAFFSWGSIAPPHPLQCCALLVGRGRNDSFLAKTLVFWNDFSLEMTGDF